jgi:hypothetical protein
VRKWLDALIDLLLPRVARPSTHEQAEEKAATQRRRDTAMMGIKSLRTPEEASRARIDLERLAEAERDRQASAEERLRAIIPLAAVAAALVLGVGLPKKDNVGEPCRVLFALAALYAVAQLLWALRAAVAGLERRTYTALTPDDLLPRPTEDETSRERRLSELWYDVMAGLQEATNRKVEQMTVAHRSLRNFIGAVMFAILVSATAYLS